MVPCSRIAHIERAHKPYALDLSLTMRRNALRVAEVWLDEYKNNVLISWNLPLKVCRCALYCSSSIKLATGIGFHISHAHTKKCKKKKDLTVQSVSKQRKAALHCTLPVSVHMNNPNVHC